MRRTWREAPLRARPLASTALLGASNRRWEVHQDQAKPQKDAEILENIWEIYGRCLGNVGKFSWNQDLSGIYGNGWLNGIWRAINDCKRGSTGNIIRIQPEVGWNHSNPQKMPQKLEILENSASFRIFLGVATAEMRISSTKVKIWSAAMIHSPIKIDPDPSSVIKRGWRKTCVWW